MFNVEILKKANKNIKKITNYISFDNPIYSKRVLDDIYDTIKLLETYPYIWPTLNWKYKKPVSKYKYTKIYYVEDETAYIVSFFRYQDLIKKYISGQC